MRSNTPILLGTALTLGLSAGIAGADANPFTLTDLGHGYMVAAEGSCGANAAGDTTDKSAEGKCGSKGETATQPPSVQTKSVEGKCGEGKCGNKG